MSATISGYHNTLQILGTTDSTVTITGTIAASGTLSTGQGHLKHGDAALYGPAGADFTLTNSGLVSNTNAKPSSYANAGIVLGAPGVLINHGAILSKSGGAVYLNAGGTVTNTGSLIGAQGGILQGNPRSGTAGIITNSGLIAATGKPFTVASGGATFAIDGILAFGAGGITNATAGTIVAQYGFGVALEAAGLDTITQQYTLESGSLLNAGTIIGQNGVALYGIATLTNTGKIFGSDSGVHLIGATALQNSGSIIGAAAGVTGYDAASISNTGLIAATGSQSYGFLGNNGVYTLAATGILLDQGGHITNSAGGIISSSFGYGVYLAGAGTVENSGLITGARAAILLTGTQDRLIEHSGGTLSGQAEDKTGDGTLELAAGAGAIGSLSGFSALQLDAGALWEITGTTSFATLLDNGTLLDTMRDTLTLGAITGAGAISINTANLTITGAVAAGETIAFSPTATSGELILEDPTAFKGAITSLFTHIGNAAGDAIFLPNLPTLTSETYANGHLTLIVPGETITLAIGGNPNRVQEINGGIEIQSTACFAPGTHIRTPAGELPIERLQIGDIIETASGPAAIKWIGRRHYAGASLPANILPIRIRAHAIAEHLPARDLLLSPGHALSIDGALIHAGRLTNGVTILQEPTTEITYYNIELETHEILFAESCPAESFMDESFRSAFSNAAEYHFLYPGHAAPAHPCQPRLTHGFALHDIQTRLAARAGIAPQTASGPLRGYVDQTGPEICFGWAQNTAAPESPVRLEIHSGPQKLGEVLANLYRADVAAAGHGTGYHGFEFPLPLNLPHPLTIRRATDHTPLPRA